MSSNIFLFSEGSDFLTSHDWEEICHEILAPSFFKQNREFFLNPISRSQEEIDILWKTLSSFLEGFDQHSLSIASQFYYLKQRDELVELPIKLKKRAELDVLELNYLCHMATAVFNLAKNETLNSIFFQKLQDFIYSKKTFRFPPTWRQFVSEEGEVSFEHHPEIRPLFLQLRKVESEIKQTMNSLAKLDLYANALASENFDLVHEHYVFSIKADSYQKKQGKIISQSKTGRTFYVTPFEVRDLYFQRIELLAFIEEEILKICREWSFYLHNYVNEFDLMREALLHIDQFFIKATYSLKKRLQCPSFSLNGEMEILGVFHPLIEDPVRNNFFLSKNQRGFLISGPNTGGKSVFLKSLALIYSFAHLGLYAPVDSAIFPYYKSLAFFSMRQQGVLEGLSSFSYEISTYLNLLKNISSYTLVIIDEIFNSTSSEEGSALAYTLFKNYFKTNEVKVFASTHHQMLKIFCHQDSQFLSAHVDFCLEKHVPNYKILLGDPGSSMAFEIFRQWSYKFSLSKDLSSEAENLLQGDILRYDRLIEKLNQQVSFNEQMKMTLLKEKGDLEKEREKILGPFKLKLDEDLKKFQEKFQKNLKESQQFVKDLKTQKVVTVKEFYEKKEDLQKKRQEILSHLPNQDSEMIKTSDSLEDEVNVWAHVSLDLNLYSLKFEKDGLVESFNEKKREIKLRIGSLSIWHSLGELKYSKKNSKKKRNDVVSLGQRKVSGKIEIDCRGMRLEEFEKKLDFHLQELLCGDIPYLNVIHGHGNGVLKNWLRKKFLPSHPEYIWEEDKHHDGQTTLKIENN